MERSLEKVDIDSILLVFEDEEIYSKINNLKLGHHKGFNNSATIEIKNQTAIILSGTHISESKFSFELEGLVNPKQAGSYGFSLSALSDDEHELEKASFKLRVEKDTAIPFSLWCLLFLIVSFLPVACGILFLVKCLQRRKPKLDETPREIVISNDDLNFTKIEFK